MEKSKSFPDSWKVSTVGKTFDVIGGGTPSTKVEEYWNGEIPWITSADIHGIKDIRPRKTITDIGIDNSATNLVPENSLIVVTRVALGKIAITDFPLCFSQDSQALIPKTDSINQKYALYYLSKEVQNFKYTGRGTTISGVTKKQLKDLTFAYPDNVEQKLIVEKIEELFSQLDAGVTGLKRVQSELQRYRASVLKTAYEGRLVSQDPNDEPAVEVLNRMGKESAIEKSQEEMPINWVWTTLKDVGTIILGQSPPSSTYNFEGIGLPFFQGKAEFGGMYPSIKKWCSEPKKIAKKDDVLISVRAPVGPTNLANQECCIGRGLAAIRAHKNILSKYILYYLRSIEDEWEHKSTGTTFKAITGSVLRNNPIPLPPLQEQYRIVEKIETILSLIDNLALKIDAELDRSDGLRNAILKTAFNGRLLNQHKLQ